MPQDYVASFSAKKADDLLHYGVKGMRWGVRHTRGSGGGTTGSSTAAKPKTDHVEKAKTSSAVLVKAAPVDHQHETATQRHARIKNEIKTMGAHHLSDEELKQFNTRHESLTKAHKAVTDPESRIHKAVQEALDAALKKVIGKATDKLIDTVTGKVKSRKQAEAAAEAAVKSFKVNPSKVVVNATPVFKVTNL